MLRVGVGWGDYRQFFEWPFFTADGEDAVADRLPVRQPLPGIPGLGRPAAQQTVAVPENDQRRIA